LRLFPRFHPPRDSSLLHSYLARILTRNTGYNCQARIRVSKGLKCREHFGTFSESPSALGTLAMGVLHADSSFSVSLQHTGGRNAPLGPRDFAHMQCAVLYTSKEGQRRVRVLNVTLEVATLAGNVFRYADAETTLAFFAKEGLIDSFDLFSVLVF
jgi:protein transport protein SEC24